MKLILLLFVFCLSEVQGYKIEVFKGPDIFQIGEGPHWDKKKQELLFVDIAKKRVIRFIPQTKQFYLLQLDGRVSLIVPICGSDDEYIIGMEQEFLILKWDGISPNPGKLTTIAKLSEISTTRTNDGKCDSKGRLIAGTYDESGGYGGNLYRLSTDGTLKKLEDNIRISNGISWSKHDRRMYYVDSPTQDVEAFDYDINSGDITNRHSVFYLPENGFSIGTPDGMAIDSDGNIWVAVFGGSQVLHINPRNGTLLNKIDFTKYASQITSVAFGGLDLDILYVTSAQDGIPPEPSSGRLFAVYDLGVKGMGPGQPFVKRF